MRSNKLSDKVSVNEYQSMESILFQNDRFKWLYIMFMLLCIYHVDDDNDDVLSSLVCLECEKSFLFLFMFLLFFFLMFFNNNILVGANDAQHPTSCC